MTDVAAPAQLAASDKFSATNDLGRRFLRRRRLAFWGMMSLYGRLLAKASPFEVTVHRGAVWCAVLTKFGTCRAFCGRCSSAALP